MFASQRWLHRQIVLLSFAARRGCQTLILIGDDGTLRSARPLLDLLSPARSFVFHLVKLTGRRERFFGQEDVAAFLAANFLVSMLFAQR